MTRKVKAKIIIKFNSIEWIWKALLTRVDESINKLKTENTSNQDFSDYVKKERVAEIVKRNLSSDDIPTTMSESELILNQ